MRRIVVRTLALGFLAMAAWVTPLSNAWADLSHTVVVKIHTVKPLDRYDELSLGDLFARVTIDGKVVVTDVLKQTTKPGQVIALDWSLSQNVAPGSHDVKLELIDKDLVDDDIIDINRLNNRRVLEFAVDTQTCRISGFASLYKCGTKIKRTGTENKKAEITFSIEVKK